MKLTFQHNQYYIEVFDDSAYVQGFDSPTQYDKVYISEDAKEFQASSKHAVIVYDGEKQVRSAIILVAAGATTVTENSALIHDNNLIMRCSNIVASLGIPGLGLNWMTEADPITCFSIYQYKENYITHGELSVARIDKSGNILWQFGGMDILLRLDGKNCFTMNDNSISIVDYNGDKYEIDYNGKSLTGFSFDTTKKVLKESDFSVDDFADDKEIQKTRAIIEAYNKMVDDALAIISNNIILKDTPDGQFDNFQMMAQVDASVVRSFASALPNLPLQVHLATYSSAFPTAKSSNSGTDQYLFGYLEINKPHPRTYVQKEDFKDKLIDLFLKRDVDFKNNKKFSRKFQVFTEDKFKLIELWQFKDLDILADFPEMELEISGNGCLFRNSRKSISITEANSFAELAKAIVKLFNGDQKRS